MVPGRAMAPSPSICGPWSSGAKIQITKDVDVDTTALLHPLLEGLFFLYSNNPCPRICCFPCPWMIGVYCTENEFTL